jgi:hypothetical protein
VRVGVHTYAVTRCRPRATSSLACSGTMMACCAEMTRMVVTGHQAYRCARRRGGGRRGFDRRPFNSTDEDRQRWPREATTEVREMVEV